MVDSVAGATAYTGIQAVNPPKPPANSATAPAAAQTPAVAHAIASSDAVSALVNRDLSNQEALAQAQTAGQQLATSGLAIANRAPQALYNALTGT